MHTTVVRKPVHDARGRLIGHQVTTYTPGRPEPRPQPTGTPPACGCACHQQDELATFNEAQWLPSDAPDWGTLAPGGLATQASDEDADLPDDAPQWS